MKVFQYVIFYDPKEADKKPSIVKDVTTILAKDIKTANILIARQIPEEYADKLEDLNIVIRDF